MPITMKIVEAQPKTKKRFTAVFRLHKGGKVIKITNFGQIGGKTFIDEGNLKKILKEQDTYLISYFGEIQLP